MVRAVIIGLVSFALFLVLHVVMFRKFKPKERFQALVAAFFFMMAGYFVIYFFTSMSHGTSRGLFSYDPYCGSMPVLDFFSGLALYVFLFLGYCQFYFIIDRSISVRVMIEIDKAGRLDTSGIKKAYSMDGILARRLEHMVEDGYLKVDEKGRYSNTGFGHKVARLFAFLKDFLGIGAGG